MNNTKLLKQKTMVLCLCHRCANDFRDSGKLLVKRGWQENKEPCDFCQVGMGFNFGVFPLKKNKIQEGDYARECY